MKIRRLCLLLAVCLLLPVALKAQIKAEEGALQSKVEQLLHGGIYRIAVHTAYPLQGPSVQLSGGYGLEVHGDSLCSVLPYYGRVYSVPYGGGNGLRLNGKCRQVSLKKLKEGQWQVRLLFVNAEDRYDYLITVFDNAKADIRVNMQNRRAISYDGELTEVEQG